MLLKTWLLEVFSPAAQKINIITRDTRWHPKIQASFSKVAMCNERQNITVTDSRVRKSVGRRPKAITLQAITGRQ